MLLPAVSRHADKPLVTNAATGASFTYAEHLDGVSRLIGGLQDLGVGRGDRYAVMTLNSPEYLQLYHAAFLGGGVVNPLNLRFAPKELAYVLRDSGTKVCFVDAIFAPLIDAVKADAGLEHVVLVGQGDVPHTMSWSDLLSAAPVIPDEREETDPVVLMYTGGTTGLPKGVLLDQRAEMLNAYHVMMRLQFDASSRQPASRRRCSTPRRCSACSAARPRAPPRRACRCSTPTPCMTAVETLSADDRR